MKSPANPSSFVDRPFGCPPDTVIDIPIPPSVNATRKVDWRGTAKLNAWKQQADRILMASGQAKAGWRNIDRYELVIVLDESRCRKDPDNIVKASCDYLRQIEVITNDAPRNARKITIEWGAAPEGVRLIVKPIEDYDAQKDFVGSLKEGYRAIRDRKAKGGPGWDPGAPAADPWTSLGDAAARVVKGLK